MKELPSTMNTGSLSLILCKKLSRVTIEDAVKKALLRNVINPRMPILNFKVKYELN
jgi:hypothetical protein